MRTSHRFIHWMGALALLALASTPAHAQKVRVGYWTSGVSLGFGAALEAQKFFEKEGLEVEYVHFPDVNAPTKAIAGNAIDFALGASAGGALSVTADGLPLKIMLATQIAELSFVVLEDSPIKTMADLRGKKIGMSPAGSATSGITAAILDGNHGMKPGTYEAVPGNEPRLAQFLVQKDVDVAAIRSVTIAQMPGVKLRTLASAETEWKTLTKSDAKPVLGVGLVRKDFLDKNPEAAVKLVVGMRKAYEFGKVNKPAVLEALVKYANMPEANAKDYANLWDGIYMVSMEPADIATLKREFEIFKSVGAVKGTLPDSAFAPEPYQKSKAMK